MAFGSNKDHWGNRRRSGTTDPDTTPGGTEGHGHQHGLRQQYSGLGHGLASLQGMLTTRFLHSPHTSITNLFVTVTLETAARRSVYFSAHIAPHSGTRGHESLVCLKASVL